MTKSQDGQDHMDKYFDTSRNILSQELKKDHVQYGSYYILEVMTNVNIFF